MSDSLKTLKELALQVRNANRIGENTPERVGRTLVGIIENIGESIFVEMLKKYIDNETVYWDDADKVIKARGGGGDTFVITVGINPANIGQCEVTATGLAVGDVVSVVATGDKNSYTVIVRGGGTVTVKVVAKNGYQVQKVNVDTVSQGAVDSYTFEAVQKEHTMYIWMEAKPEVLEPALDYIQRSDNNKIYSSLQQCFAEVKADYPEGLTRSLTVKCIKQAIVYRTVPNEGGGYRNASLEDFNVGTNYLLTIDGADLLTIDGRSLGGFYFVDVDNVVFKNITFQNCASFEKQYAPETYAAIRTVGLKRKLNNVYLYNITVNGLSTISLTDQCRYGIMLSGYRNVTIDKFRSNDISACVMKIDGSKVCTIKNSYIGGKYVWGDADGGHAYLVSVSPCENVYIHDNEVYGEGYNEVLFNMGLTDNIFFERNTVHKSDCAVMYAKSAIKATKIKIGYNHIYECMIKPLYAWDCQMFSVPNIAELEVSNNLIYIDSPYPNAFFMRSTGEKVDKLINVDNVFIRTSTTNNAIWMFGGITELVANNNVYKMNNILFYEIEEFGVDKTPLKNQRDFVKILQARIEVNSVRLEQTSKILISENGGSRHCLTAENAALYKALPEYVGEFDVEYKKNTPDNTCVGAYNYYSAEYDETTDTSDGYTGVNLADKQAFSSAAKEQVPAEDVLLLIHNTKNRNKAIRYNIYKHGEVDLYSVGLGNRSTVSLLPVLDDNGEYVSDQLYDVEIVNEI